MNEIYMPEHPNYTTQGSRIVTFELPRPATPFEQEMISTPANSPRIPHPTPHDSRSQWKREVTDGSCTQACKFIAPMLFCLPIPFIGTTLSFASYVKSRAHPPTPSTQAEHTARINRTRKVYDTRSPYHAAQEGHNDHSAAELLALATACFPLTLGCSCCTICSTNLETTNCCSPDANCALSCYDYAFCYNLGNILALSCTLCEQCCSAVGTCCEIIEPCCKILECCNMPDL